MNEPINPAQQEGTRVVFLLNGQRIVGETARDTDSTQRVIYNRLSPDQIADPSLVAGGWDHVDIHWTKLEVLG